MYGGGPMIVRDQLDIYSVDLSKELTSSKRKRDSNKDSGSAGASGYNTNNIFSNAKPAQKPNGSQIMG